MGLVNYLDIIIAVYFVLVLSVYLTAIHLSRKLAKMADNWLLKSSKIDLFSNLLPFVVGLIVVGSIAFWFIAEIENWPLWLFLIFPLIFSLPLIVVTVFLLFREDTYTVIRVLPAEPERIVSYLNSKLNDCRLKKNIMLGGWTAKCHGFNIGVFINSTRSPMKSRVFVENIKRETVDAAREIIKIINAYSQR